jgi:hypothetical protein
MALSFDSAIPFVMQPFILFLLLVYALGYNTGVLIGVKIINQFLHSNFSP